MPYNYRIYPKEFLNRNIAEVFENISRERNEHPTIPGIEHHEISLLDHPPVERRYGDLHLNSLRDSYESLVNTSYRIYSYEIKDSINFWLERYGKCINNYFNHNKLSLLEIE